MIVPTRALKILCALVWYIGGFVLLFKTGSLLSEASALRPKSTWPVYAVIIGVVIGGVKGLLLFNRACHRNLTRIDALEHKRVWLFFRPRFFFFLFLMIASGATLSRLSHGHFGGLIGVGILDLTIATALLSSSYVFWKRRAFG